MPTTPNIDWKGIRPWKGSRGNGFEELCAQLARAESPAGSHFERKGSPDAGVECYAVLSDGNEWGWQAKYFFELGKPQWSQLDESVKTALEKHPRLARYFVCVPLDRPDPRVDGQSSAKKRWDEHVQKWEGWASVKTMTVEFVYWGSHELLARLTRSQPAGLVRYWFGVDRFDEAWFKARLDEALKTAGPRYTPEIHVDLPIAADLEAFGRTQRFFDEIKAHARGIREKLRAFGYAEPKVVDPTLAAPTSAVQTKVEAVLAELGAVAVLAVGVLPFQRIADQVAAAEAAAGELAHLLMERKREHDAQPPEAKGSTATPARNSNPFTEWRFRLAALSSRLRITREALVHAEAVAGCTLMLLKGRAGTGKTHLLCDLAQRRVAAGQPTVLLMGQQFVSPEAPWTQALQHLDLSDLSAGEFVGALEAAAQAAGYRALVLIDAINEGSGRLIWPSHLAAFLAHLGRSPWIGVLLSVRSSYEEDVVPEEVRSRAVSVTHQGFADHEYDATQTFFVHYGLELPSTPLLAPEFRNPLFLKTLCHGLKTTGERRLPRGFHGITTVFDLYLSAINQRLASTLDFNPKDPLVRRALEALATALVDPGERCLSLAKAQEVVNTLLPGRGFERSLYRGLVVEGALVQEAVWRKDSAREEVAFIAYERFADHLVAKSLLDRHLDPDAPESAFAEGGPLAFLWDGSQYLAPGLLEAMCIQVPERTGQELVALAPKLMDHWGIGDAFRQSLVWRALSAFSEGTREALNKLVRSDHDLDDTLDALLTVATLPEHPLNARLLDRRLRQDSMSERDAWWSISLHHAWGHHGAVDRLVDWASAVTPGATLDDETVELCSTALSWMLTTSNRPLRDRATKALVSLLTDRLPAVARLVQRFADVDDPYVTERVYAVAYGTAMRSHDPAEVGNLATCVYLHVFASGAPPAHILLRDYARGVVERAIHLGAKLEVDVRQTRPPYKSEWPRIPTEDDIKALRGSDEWSHNRIGSSVMDDDFARYVIGTNSWSTGWLSLRFEEPTWQSPDALMAMFVKGFSEKERLAWDRLRAAEDMVIKAFHSKLFAVVRQRAARKDALPSEASQPERAEEPDRDLPYAEQVRDAALAALEAVLTEEHSRSLKELRAVKDPNDRRAPRFDLRLTQRYVLWRVFNLGWTKERFGDFDRLSIGYRSRDASKAERIGKKYQWIAYHEIMALVADHFQYREEFREERADQTYDGPWQDGFRDIDPSCTLRASRGGKYRDGHAPAWWGAAWYETWGDHITAREWVMQFKDLPKMEDLLGVSRDASRWLNMQSYVNWTQQQPADQESTDVDRRELWCICTGYLIRAQDADAFVEWAEGVDLWGRWMPDPPHVYRMLLGEHGWSPASRYFQQEYFGDPGWAQPDRGCPVKVRTAAFEYSREAGSFDCSVDESYTLKLPASELVTGLGLRWSRNGADYVDAADRLAAFDPSAFAEEPSALLLREDLLREFLAREGLTICWAVVGEKQVLPARFTREVYASLRMSGAYVLTAKGPRGFLKCMLDERKAQTAEHSQILATIRTP